MMLKQFMLAGLVSLGAQSGAQAFVSFQPGVVSFDIDCDCSTPGFKGTVGYEFQVTSPQSINRLGVYDNDGDGLAFAKQVGLWNVATGQLIASTIIPAGNGSTLVGQFRYTTISEITLNPSEVYSIGAFYDGFVLDPDLYQSATSNNIFSPWFEYSISAFAFDKFVRPVAQNIPPYGYYGPNLAYEVPGPLPLAGAIAAFSTSRRLRRRIRQRGSVPQR